MTVHQITTPEQFDQVIKESLVIVDFNAEWCGPCKMIKPAFHALAKQHPQMKFAAVDIDQVPEAADKAQVSAMPTFQIYKGGNMIFEMKGADKAGLEQAIKKAIKDHAPVGSSTTSPVQGHLDLQPFISNQLECLNQDSKHPIQNIFKSAGVLKSDVDEQLILCIPFNQPVKVHSIKFISSESGPKVIKTFVNRISTLSFDEVDSAQAVETIELTSDNLLPDTPPTALRFVKYQYVHHLTIFIENNQDGSDVTQVQRLVLYGSPLEATKDVSELKKMDDGHDH